MKDDNISLATIPYMINSKHTLIGHVGKTGNEGLCFCHILYDYERKPFLRYLYVHV